MSPRCVRSISHTQRRVRQAMAAAVPGTPHPRVSTYFVRGARESPCVHHVGVVRQSAQVHSPTRYRGRAVGTDRNADLGPALEALGAGELRSFIREALDGLDDGPQGTSRMTSFAGPLRRGVGAPRHRPEGHRRGEELRLGWPSYGAGGTDGGRQVLAPRCRGVTRLGSPGGASHLRGSARADRQRGHLPRARRDGG